MNQKKQVCKLDTHRTYAGTTTSAEEYHSISYFDNAADTFVIVGGAWIIEEVSGNTATVKGYYADDTTKYNIPIGMVVSSIEFPENNTILVVAY